MNTKGMLIISIFVVCAMLGAISTDIEAGRGRHPAQMPAPVYDSGWVSSDSDEVELVHGIGGDINNYLVDVLRGYESDGVLYCYDPDYFVFPGPLTHVFTTSGIKVSKLCDRSIRVRIWLHR